MIVGKPGAAIAETKDGVAWVALDRPDKRNALDGSVWTALGEIGQELCQDSSVRVAVVYGKGKSFCAGLDLSVFGSPSSMLLSGVFRESSVEAPSPEETGDSIERSIQSLQNSITWLSTAPFPTIAAVHGHALGAGWQLALACDFIVAARGSQFGMLETRLGLVPDMGGTARLVRNAGIAAAKYLIFTGKKVRAEDLLCLGLVAEIVNEDVLMKRVGEIAQDFCERSPTALREAKRLVEEAFLQSLHQALKSEAAAQKLCLRSPDFAKAVSAFLQKQRATFSSEPAEL